MPKPLIICISILLIQTSLNAVTAQQITYSDPIGRADTYQHIQAIGKIGENIIIWQQFFSGKAPDILFYDKNWKLLNKTSLDNIHLDGRAQFINEKDSFVVITQFGIKNSFVCRMSIFDKNGVLKRAETIDSSLNLVNNQQRKFIYEVVPSTQYNKFALIKILYADSIKTINVQYRFFEDNRLIHTDEVIMPYVLNISSLCNIIADDNYLLIGINNWNGASNKFGLYKINMRDNTVINSIEPVDDSISVLQIKNINKYYSVVSGPKNYMPHVDTNNKVFLWQETLLNKNLDEEKTNVVSINSDSLQSCFLLSDLASINIIQLNNNTKNVFASYVPGAIPLSAFNTSGSNNIPGSIAGSASFYSGRIQSTNGLQQIGVGTGVYYSPARGQSSYSNVPSAGSLNNYTQKSEASDFKLTVYNVDTANTLSWVHCFDKSLDGSSSDITNYTYLQEKNSVHIIYVKNAGKRQLLSDLILKSDGSYSIKPIITMKLNSIYFLGNSTKVDDNTLIIQYEVNNRFGFAKLTIN